MLQITEYSTCFKLDLQKKKHGPKITTERAWASARGENDHSPPFWKLELTKNQNLLANLKSGAHFPIKLV